VCLNRVGKATEIVLNLAFVLYGGDSVTGVNDFKHVDTGEEVVRSLKSDLNFTFSARFGRAK
jgi:hypothetical protein